MSERKVSKAQMAILELLHSGFPVNAELCGDRRSWRAMCECLPVIHITSVHVLEKLGFVRHNHAALYRTYSLTPAGRALVEAARGK